MRKNVEFFGLLRELEGKNKKEGDIAAAAVF